MNIQPDPVEEGVRQASSYDSLASVAWERRRQTHSGFLPHGLPETPAAPPTWPLAKLLWSSWRTTAGLCVASGAGALRSNPCGDQRIVLVPSAHGVELDAYVKHADIADLIHGTTSSDDAERAKPHGDISEAALKLLPGIAPNDAIVVGDMPYDIKAAAKVGLRAIGLLSGGFAKHKRTDAGAIAVYRDSADLLAHFERIRRLCETATA